MAKLHYEGECCSDCAMFIANGEHIHDAQIKAITKRWPGRQFHLSVGDQVNEFSRSECDACGSRLGGERHAFVVLKS